MRRIAVLSTNNNPDYFFYAPIVEWAWNRLGWDVAVFATADVDEDELNLNTPSTIFKRIPDLPCPSSRELGSWRGTLAQTVRHFTANELPDGSYIMVQDIDLIPLRAWEPDLEKKTIYGWELTGHSFIPVHYTGMKKEHWMDIMGCSGDLAADMDRAIRENGRAYGENWDVYWDTDWDILTQKVLPRKNEFTFIRRGMGNFAKDATPIGRVDRYDYEKTKNQPELIDLHASNHNPSSDEKWEVIKEMITKCFGEMPGWMDAHREQHHKKYGQGR